MGEFNVPPRRVLELCLNLFTDLSQAFAAFLWGQNTGLFRVILGYSTGHPIIVHFASYLGLLGVGFRAPDHIRRVAGESYRL
jgi:hypothetical protein